MAVTLPSDVAVSITLGEAGTVSDVVVDNVDAIVQNVSTPVILSFDPVKGDTGSPGPPGPPGPQGPSSSAAVSADPNNKATLGTDSLVLVQGTAPGTAATTHTQTVSGDDPQLTNPRIPTAHAASHAHGGSDPVTITYSDLAGVPSTFTPNPHEASHVTGTDQIPSASTSVRGLMPQANGNPNAFYASDGSQKQVSYSMLSGSQPGPIAHAPSHLDNGSDVIPVVTSTRTGLAPKLSGNASTYLDGTGFYSAPAGGGDMLKSVYDVNNDGIVDRAAITFFTKTAAYTLTSADSGKYVICSGGSWTLTLPAPIVGLNYRLRNDMGISGTTGTITLQPTGGTIDGQASIPLLPQQECILITDGTNWRTHGLKREVILGTQDITTAQASGIILLPAGYRYFELEFTGVTPVTNNDYLVAQLSSDGGNTWTTASYYYGGISNTASAPNFSQSLNGSNWEISQSAAAAATSGELRMVLYPGSASTVPSFHADGSNWTGTILYKWLVGGFLNTTIRINALKYFGGLGGNFTSFLTVKGIV